LVPMMYRMVFILFVSFAIFAVVNVVTGVFVESAIKTSGDDKDGLIKENIRNVGKFKSEIDLVFREMDGDETGTLTLEEFTKHLDDERVIAYFNTLKLDVSDAPGLFKLLDDDNSGSVEIEEFVEGCQKLKGESRSLDTHLIRYELNDLSKKIIGMASKLENLHEHSRGSRERKKSEPHINTPMWKARHTSY